MGELPRDPEHDPLGVVPEPPESVLRDLRERVKSLGGKVYRDYHSHRTAAFKKAPDRFSSVTVPLANCDHDHVICDIKTNDDPPNVDDTGMLRICLVCDAGDKVIGLSR